MRRHSAQRAPANEVRIVGGTWRSRRIRFPAGADIRPTPDRVRETLFNWMGQDLTGLSCLDLFAGSGALGFEAASRGARRVVLVEKHRAAHAALLENRALLDAGQVEVLRSDALDFLRMDRTEYDLVFLDPPFAAGYAARVLPFLPGRMTVGAWLYHESPERLDWPAGWRVLKDGRAGQVCFQLVQWTPDEPHGGISRDIRPGHPGS
jgi:16S rRNA (guanine966-N2)-methyltransferase